MNARDSPRGDRSEERAQELSLEVGLGCGTRRAMIVVILQPYSALPDLL